MCQVLSIKRGSFCRCETGFEDVTLLLIPWNPNRSVPKDLKILV